MASVKLFIYFFINCLAISPSLARHRCNKIVNDVKGIIAPVFTPTDCNGNINFDIIPDYAQYLKDNNVDAVLVGGYTGEGPTLSVSEYKELINAWVEAIKPLNLKIAAIIGGRPFPDVLELAKFSERQKLNVIVTLPELFYKPKTSEQVIRSMEIIACHAPNTPIVYYDIPRITNVYLDLVNFTIQATQRIPTFKGIGIDYAYNALRVKSVLEKDQRLYIANSSYLAPAAYLGADSFVFSEINFVPELVETIIKLASQGNLKEANREFGNLLDLTEIILSEDCIGEQIPAYKAAMGIITGLDVGPARQPEADIDDSRKADLEKRLEKIGYTRCIEENQK